MGYVIMFMLGVAVILLILGFMALFLQWVYKTLKENQ